MHQLTPAANTYVSEVLSDTLRKLAFCKLELQVVLKYKKG